MKIHNHKHHRIIAWTLILLVLMTSVSFTIDKHYCEGELQSINVFGKAKPCSAAKKNSKEIYCPVHKKMMKMDEGKSCCENKSTFVNLDNDLVNIDFQLPFSPVLEQFAVAYILVFHAKITADKQSIQEFTYQSPLISRDICVLSETFLL